MRDIGGRRDRIKAAAHRLCLGGGGRHFTIGLVAKSVKDGSDCRTRDKASHHRILLLMAIRFGRRISDPELPKRGLVEPRPGALPSPDC
jgi:hypothetical protein